MSYLAGGAVACGSGGRGGWGGGGGGHGGGGGGTARGGLLGRGASFCVGCVVGWVGVNVRDCYVFPCVFVCLFVCD
jgi:hypothetical protein